MTSPGGRDTPASQLLSLTLEVATLSRVVDELRGRIPPEGHDEAHTELSAMLEKLVAAHDAAPLSFHWPDLDDDERAKRETDLRAWVTDVLTVWHPTQAAALRECWWDHLDVRQAVTAAWLAWGGAYRFAGRKRRDPFDWVANDLPKMVALVQQTLGPAREPECHACERDKEREREAAVTGNGHRP